MTHKKQVTQSIEEQLHTLEEIIGQLPGHVFWKDVNCRFLGCNDLQAKTAGLKKREDIIGLSALDIINPNQPESERLAQAAAIDSIDQHVMQQDKIITVEEPLTLDDGTEKVFLSYKMPLHDQQGKVNGLVGISIDITEQKLAEKREQKAAERAAAERERAKVEIELRQSVMVLAGCIAHDMRTPLLNVRMIANITKNINQKLLESYTLAQQANISELPHIKKSELEKLASIPNELENIVVEMNSYIDDSLKTLSRVLTHDLKPDDLVRCSADYSIRHAIANYPFEKNEADSIHIDSEYQFDFMGNQILMFRVLSNLLKNSLYEIKQANKGAIYITTTSTETYNQIIFKDTAAGASAQVVEKIFDGFKTTKQVGTGIGLSFCKLTMKSFGGDITCYGIDGDYIQFVLSFPIIE